MDLNEKMAASQKQLSEADIEFVLAATSNRILATGQAEELLSLH